MRSLKQVIDDIIGEKSSIITETSYGQSVDSVSCSCCGAKDIILYNQGPTKKDIRPNMQTLNHDDSCLYKLIGELEESRDAIYEPVERSKVRCMSCGEEGIFNSMFPCLKCGEWATQQKIED